jgi:RNA polymerase primary sigma factor
VANTKNIIRLPVNITEELRRIKYNERTLSQELGREPSNKELADKMGIATERIDHINSIINKEPISLEAFDTDHLKEEGYET